MKEEWKSTKSFYDSFLRRKAPRPARIETVCRKKAKVDLRIEPGLHGQKYVALPLALPPLPNFLVVGSEFFPSALTLNNLEQQ